MEWMRKKSGDKVMSHRVISDKCILSVYIPIIPYFSLILNSFSVGAIVSGTINTINCWQHLQVRQGRIAQLKAVGGLGTCGCCFDDELLPEEMPNKLRVGGLVGHRRSRGVFRLAFDQLRICMFCVDWSWYCAGGQNIGFTSKTKRNDEIPRSAEQKLTMPAVHHVWNVADIWETRLKQGRARGPPSISLPSVTQCTSRS